jgi:hypothetical protein
MRETRLSGSEGGARELNRVSLPLSRAAGPSPTGAQAVPLLRQQSHRDRRPSTVLSFPFQDRQPN